MKMQEDFLAKEVDSIAAELQLDSVVECRKNDCT